MAVTLTRAFQATAAVILCCILLTVAANALFGGGVIASLSLIPLLLVLIAANSLRKAEHQPEPETPAGEAEAEAGAGTTLVATGHAQRMYWVDHVKTLLISMVVAGHAGLSFFGTGWYYTLAWYPNWFHPFAASGFLLLKPVVVPMFFLLSGFFVPSALSKRGSQRYLYDLLTRFGPVFLLWVFAVEPALAMFFTSTLHRPQRKASYVPSAGVIWFLLWLLVFNNIYVLVLRRYGSYSPPRPSLARMIVAVLKVAAMQTGLSCLLLFVGGTTALAGMPFFSGGDGLNCALWFFAGIAAKEGDWQSTMLAKRDLKAARWIVGVTATLVVLAVFLCLSPAPPIDLGKQNTVFALFALFLQVVTAPFSVSFALLLLRFAKRAWNVEKPLLSKLSQASYYVYLLHLWIIVPLAFAFVQMLEATHSTFRPRWEENKQGQKESSTRFPSDWLVFAGALFTMSLGVAVSFAVAMLAKQVMNARRPTRELQASLSPSVLP